MKATFHLTVKNCCNNTYGPRLYDVTWLPPDVAPSANNVALLLTACIYGACLQSMSFTYFPDFNYAENQG